MILSGEHDSKWVMKVSFVKLVVAVAFIKYQNSRDSPQRIITKFV